MCKFWFEQELQEETLQEYCRLTHKKCLCCGILRRCECPTLLKEVIMTNEMIRGATYLLLRAQPIVNGEQYNMLNKEVDEMQEELDKETDELVKSLKYKEKETNDSK